MRRLVPCLFALLILTACSPREPLRVGFLAGLSGNVADLGEAGRNGAQIAVEEVNRAGGIHGRPVELIVRDDAQSPEKAIAAANELGLPWVLFVDNDAAGVQAVSAIIDPDTSAAMTFASNRVVIAGAKAIEQLLIDAGYGDEVTAIAADHGETISTEKEQLKFLSHHKGWVGEAVASLALRNGKAVPPSVATLAQRIQELLGSAQPPEVKGALS